ncbi:MAG TPA: hypothetical protein VHC96_03445 [Puia sp.]|nr:hypothetical protein [Puia sp.]
MRIYYDKATLMPTCTLGYNPPYYKPDLLIRGWNDHRAFLIEIKADEEKHSEKTIRNEKVARNYILQQGFDWEYKLILYSEIQSAMTKEQTIIFMRDVREAADLHAFKRRSEKLDRRFRKGEVSYKRKLTYFIDGREVTEAENNNFVKRAILPDSFD